MDNINNLLQNVRHLVELDNQRKEEARKRGEKYNIFSVLGLETSEVKTHSAFLASLLDPDGDHGVGSAFLDSFVKEMNIDELLLNTTNSSVKVEHVTNDGRIDIIISDDNNKAIIIENKIYAGDQPEQLKRYYNFAQQQFTNGYKLIYLTLDGHKPSEESTKELKENQYVRIAYNHILNSDDEDSSNFKKHDILYWLEGCVKTAYNKPLVRETINQYISLIKNLTIMDTDKETTDYLVNLLATENNFKTASLIANNIVEIKKHIVEDNLIPMIKEKIKTEKDLKGCQLKGHFYDNNIYSGFEFSFDKWNKATIYFEFEKNNSSELIYGIVLPKERDEAIIRGFKYNNLWAAYKDVKKYCNWNDDTFVDIFNGKVADMFVSHIKELLELTKGKEDYL